ncbi:conserved hypothetical protein [Crocosphaera subtropica ATCC 51142]|uniref:Uncharacterized protein n=1 Tax=Crocosphaera subtropica (strain ATCC 51142 / BH68) TaxID=43989 RepID=B1WU14_CROS5|nr:DUF4079 domain-containing protein [Crocosphaera subtropica]ACB52076.1 conserved hypothetical protein [Crocosphaera subtropica ATCC 51142]
MNLPSFLWLWKIAAWSMGLSLFAYVLLGLSGGWMFYGRHRQVSRPVWLRWLHYIIGSIMVILVLLLLVIGLVGTLGHYGSLGHSFHLLAGLLTVILVLISATAATQISPEKPRMRWLHIGTNIMLFFSFAFVSLTGWTVVQKYLP